MIAITICQPYAELIMRGEKRVENRTWATGYRGSLLIHAGASREWMEDGDMDRFPGMAFGEIVGGATLVDCVSVDRLLRMASERPTEFGWARGNPHVNGAWCFVLENIHRLRTPVICKGHQKLWNVEAAALNGAEWVRVERTAA